VQQIWQVPKTPRRALERVEGKLPADDSGKAPTAAETDYALGTLVVQNAFQWIRSAARDVAQRVALRVEKHHQIARLEPNAPAFASQEPA